MDVISEFACWPPSAPLPLRHLLRHRLAKALLRRLPRPISRSISRPNVYGELRGGECGTICIVSHSLAAAGAPKVVMDMALDLIRAGYGLVVVSPADGPYRQMLVNEGAVVVVDYDIMSGQSQTMRVVTGADAVICNTIHCRLVVGAAQDVPVMWYIHEANLIADMVNEEPHMKTLLAAPRAVWAVSEMAAAYLRPFRPDVGILVPGITPLMDKAAVLPIHPQSVVKLAVFANIEPRKGQDLLVAAIEQLADDEKARLDIVVYGGLMQRDYAEAWLKSIERLPNIRYGGSLSPADVPDKLIAMDGVIIPSRDEPHSLVAAEAFSVGRVVLCSKQCGIAEHLVNGVDAFVADDCTPERLAAMLRQALSETDQWVTVAEAGYKKYCSLFARSHMTSQIIAELKSAIEARDGMKEQPPSRVAS